MQDFKDEGIMLMSVDFASLQAGFDTLEESLYHNKACFHKNVSCNSTHRALKGKSASVINVSDLQCMNQLSVKLQRLQMLLAVVVIIFYSTHYERDTKI